MNKIEYLNNQLTNGTDLLKSFKDPSCVRHIEIPNIDISIFSLPKFNEEGKFIGGPTAF